MNFRDWRFYHYSVDDARAIVEALGLGMRSGPRGSMPRRGEPQYTAAHLWGEERQADTTQED